MIVSQYRQTRRWLPVKDLLSDRIATLRIVRHGEE
jgi:hypothetical protein